MIAPFPRYQELLNKRGGSSEEEIEAALESVTTEEFRDLQVWFNLAWSDPDFLKREPLQSLVEKSQGFSEADKRIVFDPTLEIIRAVAPKHGELQERGQIEVITTPYAHPILPPIYNGDLAEKGGPGAELPECFSYPQDAIAHLSKSVEVYREHYRWELIEQPDDLYRPYYIHFRDGLEVGMVFRDVRLSDLIGFEYSGTPEEVAARDFIDRLDAIRLCLQWRIGGGPLDTNHTRIMDLAWPGENNPGQEEILSTYSPSRQSNLDLLPIDD